MMKKTIKVMTLILTVILAWAIALSFTACKEPDEGDTTTVPGAVASFTATAGDGQVVLTWTAPADNGGSAVTGYEVTRDNWANKAAKTAAELTHTYTGLTNGTEYTFKVRAVNAKGAGAESEKKATPVAADNRVELTAGPGVPAAFDAVTAAATFTGATGLTLAAADFTVTGGLSITNVAVSGGTTTVTVGLTTNPNNTPRTFTVGINPTSTVIKGSTTVTITQAANPGGEDPCECTGKGDCDCGADCDCPACEPVVGTVATPIATPPAGAVAIGTTVTLSTTTVGATIRYTTNGTDPTASSTAYSSPIAITQAVTIKAIAMKSGMNDSGMLTAAYTIAIDPNIITSAAALTAYLATATGGATAANPITVALNVDDLGGDANESGSIGNIISQSGKYVSLDLSGSTFTSIEDLAFEDCTSLVSVIIGDSVTSIGGSAFYGCTSLVSVIIGDSVTSIEYGAFYNCTSLESVTIGNSVTIIGSNAFYSCTSLAAINVDAANTVYISENGVLYNKAKTALLQYPAGKTNTSFTIPSSVTSIGDNAFSRCYNLENVTIPSSVTIIGQSAFSGCTSLASVTIPDSVTNMGVWAFQNCSNLASVTIGNSVTSIGSVTFGNCTSLESVTIGNSVTSIENNAFSSCTSLRDITINTNKVSNTQSSNWGHRFPANNLNVTFNANIGDNAFYNCTRLIGVTIGNSVTSIGNFAFYAIFNLDVTFEGDSTNFDNNAFGLSGYASYLYEDYITGGIGTYTRRSPSTIWTKQ